MIDIGNEELIPIRRVPARRPPGANGKQVHVDTVCMSIHKQGAPIVAIVSTSDLPSTLHSRCDAVNAREKRGPQLLFLGFIGGAVAV